MDKPATPNRQQDQADRERQAKQWDLVKSYVAANPGLSHRSAYHLAQRDHPALFRDDTGQTPQEQEDVRHSISQKQQRIHDEIARMREGPNGEKKMTFTRAWNLLREQKPHLFDFEKPKPQPESLQSLTARASTVYAALARAYERKHAAAIEVGEYIELRAEDADRLMRQVETGLWD